MATQQQIRKLALEKARIEAESSRNWLELQKGQLGVSKGNLALARYDRGVQAARLGAPLLIGAIVLLFLVGPATFGLIEIATSVSWYWWVALIVVILIFMRNG